ncbi:hypothetical protein [Larkinella terrae]|uniref:Uncharacterized protein n=1 Tax=Larkinella terrae TaxID=2025311 RepID=A0A7K0EEP3_9BACT|nr:hypothetical protein [Larkinella terrae]MRS60310.1 hypothetical protein [Larkinella terrae]
MKNANKRIQLVVLLFGLLGFWSCTIKREVIVPTGNDFSTVIVNTIPQEAIDKVRDLGVTVYDGRTPPDIQGIYFVSELRMTKTTVPNDSYTVGSRFTDQKVNIYNQDASRQLAQLDQKTFNTNTGALTSESKGQKAFISGRGNQFTVFVVSENVKQNNSRSRLLDVFSGEINAQGVRNMQYSLLVLEDYGDINNDIIPINTGRSFKDADGFSERISVFRLKANEKQESTDASATPDPLPFSQ